MRRIPLFLLYVTTLSAGWDWQLSLEPNDSRVICEAQADQWDDVCPADLLESLTRGEPSYIRTKESDHEVWSQWFSASVGPYKRPDTTSDEAWDAVQPYLLPENFPLRKTLDRIFSASRVTADRESLAAAGFSLTPDQGLHVVVAFHKELKGYLIKTVLDLYDHNNDGKGSDWQQWVQRIAGERHIRNAVAELGYKSYFKVPRQWIYPLPSGPKCPDKEGYFPKSFILIVEDMKLESKENNTKFYRKMGKKLMGAIYVITTKYGLSDCCNKHNLPLCKDGKLAFVDTESFNKWPIDYHRMIEFLSPEGRVYWKKLRDQGGPKKK